MSLENTDITNANLLVSMLSHVEYPCSSVIVREFLAFDKGVFVQNLFPEVTEEEEFQWHFKN